MPPKGKKNRSPKKSTKKQNKEKQKVGEKRLAGAAGMTGDKSNLRRIKKEKSENANRLKQRKSKKQDVEEPSAEATEATGDESNSPTNEAVESNNANGSKQRKNKKQVGGAPSVEAAEAARVRSKLPKTACDVCGKLVVTKVLKRHKNEQHSLEKTHNCDMCSFTSNRNDRLLDHKRRIHFEPIRMGRPAKKENRKRRRSPFNKEEFANRHTESMKINTAMTGKLMKVTTDIEELKIRMAIVESKHKPLKMPALDNIEELLRYFRLEKSSSIDDIRNEINIRTLETSSESLVNSGTDMTDEERDDFVTFLNEAQQVLLKWKRDSIQESSN